MSLSTLSAAPSSQPAIRIPLVERRPQFEAALAQINQRKENTDFKNKVKATPLDSFGAWFEAD